MARTFNSDALRLGLVALLAVICVAVFPAIALGQDADRDGVVDADDKCPETAEDRDGDADDDGCPEDGDRDGDGIPDSKDLCLNLAEDVDGDHDDDGCPDHTKDKDEDGVDDTTDACPYEPEDHDGYKDRDGCPDPDNDADGIADSFDACTMLAEDMDGFEDDDGCPESDNDQDKIPDVADACPNDAEDYDGHDDTDGCPDLKLVVLKADKIEVKEKIYFALDSDEILVRSFGILDEIAALLVDNPEIEIEVQGHTDSQGESKYNARLSASRAKSVRAYLIGQGVAAERLTSKGFGETSPIASNATEEGRAQNRRVEFIITKR